MRKGFHARFIPVPALAAVLVLHAALPRGVRAAPVSAGMAAVDSSGASGGAGSPADTARAAPSPAPGSRAAPHDVVHMHGGTPPAAPGGAAKGPKPKPFKIVVPKGSPRVLKVSLGVRHRVFADFAEKSEAPMGKVFQIGDSRYSATVTDFEPDFVIDLPSHSITSRSTEPRNPAFRIIVRDQGVPEDTTWAFLNMAPHFTRNSLLAFEILRIEFADRPPLVRDSTDLGRPKP